MDAAQLQADARLIISEWAESLVFVPGSGPERDILGVVERDPSRVLAESPAGGVGYAMAISIVNSATSISDDDFGGISDAELDTARDKLRVSPRVGGSTEDRLIIEIIEQDEGLITVAVR